MINQKTFAFFISIINNTIGNAMLRGTLEKARGEKINLICFNGGDLGEDLESAIYEMVNPQWIQGIISWASPRQNVNSEVFHKYHPLPIITLSMQQTGIPVVMADSYRGMKEVVEHFINLHKHTKIAFIRGPENHIYAQERYQAYLDTLKVHNIPVDNNLITPPGTWSTEWGVESIKLLLTSRGLKPGKDIESIVGVSDLISIPALNTLQEMGVKVPREIAISGYNDSIDARCSTPPLTSVAMPFMEQGRKAIEMLMSALKMEQLPERVVLPAKMVLGQSCGCLSPAIESAAMHAMPDIVCHEGFFRKMQRRMMEKCKPQQETPEQSNDSDNLIISAMTDSGIKVISEVKITDSFIEQQSRALLEAYKQELDEEILGAFLNTLSEILKKTVDRKGRVEIWHSVISVMRNNILSSIKDKIRLFKTEALWQQARVMIGETAERVKESFYLRWAKSEHILRNISAKLITTYDLNKLMDVLAESLPQLEIPSCYLALYEKSAKAFPERARLVMAYNEQGRIMLEGEGRLFETRNFIPREYLPQNRNYAFIVEPLHFQEKQLGFVIFEAGPEEGYIYFSLKNQLSSALYGALLLQERAEVKSYLQATLHRMHDRARVVTDSSMNISANVNEISASMEEVAASIQEISRHIGTVMDRIDNSVIIAQDANGSITDLTENSRKIGDIVDIINDIADQTKILALNAAIEAAHAGSRGRGFDIVAKEVKKLARKTVLSTNEINQMIKKTQNNTDETAGAINRLVEIINQISELSRTITIAIKQQAEATSEISNLLIAAAGGSGDISQAISEVASLGDDLDL